jgi:hypothetical protein
MTDAMGAYLRVCSSGGMPKTTRLAIEGAFAEALRLGYFDEILRTAGGKDSSDARDAERYRWLVVRGQVNSSKIDAAIAGEKK